MQTVWYLHDIPTHGIFTPAGPAAAVNLFDQVVGNDGDAEAEAVAHETPVLLPPRSRFLMSDVTRLRPLLPGAAAQHPLQNLPKRRLPMPLLFTSATRVSRPPAAQHDADHAGAATHRMQLRRCMCVVYAAGWPGERYDMVVLDPPWENASAKRAWRYPTLPSRNLLAIPMRRLLRPVRCRVCARQIHTFAMPVKTPVAALPVYSL